MSEENSSTDWDLFKNSIIDEVTRQIAEEIDNEILEDLREKSLTPEEREAEEIIRRLKGIKRFPKIPMIRNIIPNLTANEIIGVQPMTGPSGQIYTMTVTYKDFE